MSAPPAKHRDRFVSLTLGGSGLLPRPVWVRAAMNAGDVLRFGAWELLPVGRGLAGNAHPRRPASLPHPDCWADWTGRGAATGRLWRLPF